MSIPYSAYWYEKDSKKGDHIDEYIILREATIHFGRTVTILITLLFMTQLNFSLQDTFLFGALSYLLLGLFSKNNIKLIDEQTQKIM